jgi:hypothetical protein
MPKSSAIRGSFPSLSCSVCNTASPGTLRHSPIKPVSLAAKCNLVGLNISRGTLAKIEAKVRRVVDIEVEEIALALRVDIEDLFKKN